MLIGTANLEEFSARAPTVKAWAGEAVTLEQADVLQVAYEIATPHREAMLPPGLHPTDPPIVTWLFYRCPTSPWGSFTIAQTRIECRSGLRLRAFLVGAALDNTAAAQALGKRWGFATLDARIELHRYYDSLRAAVVAGGRTILDVAVSDPDPLSAADIQYIANMNLAHTPRGLRLVQVEPRYQVHRIERGRPRLASFDGAAWGDARIEPVYPVSASIALADVTIPRVRFVCRPDVLAFEGTESVA
ncbi:MAG TPA: acetoacetate decarboxylase family protein [Candidatus Binatia bacterium]|nr:acetoacetate decarboxylase family protein [Candidatus Binatia bacterium]